MHDPALALCDVVAPEDVVAALVGVGLEVDDLELGLVDALQPRALRVQVDVLVPHLVLVLLDVVQARLVSQHHCPLVEEAQATPLLQVRSQHYVSFDLYLGCLLNEFLLRVDSSGGEDAFVAFVLLLLVHELLSERAPLELLEVVGRLHQEYLVEVRPPEVRMRLQRLKVVGRTRLSSTQPPPRIPLEELRNQIPGLWAEVVSEGELNVLNVVEGDTLVCGLEGRPS